MNFNKSPIFKRLTTTGFLPKPGVFFFLYIQRLLNITQKFTLTST